MILFGSALGAREGRGGVNAVAVHVGNSRATPEGTILVFLDEFCDEVVLEILHGTPRVTTLFGLYTFLLIVIRLYHSSFTSQRAAWTRRGGGSWSRHAIELFRLPNAKAAAPLSTKVRM